MSMNILHYYFLAADIFCVHYGFFLSRLGGLG